MQIYKVGGAVRDRLLEQPVTEIDWVVVGGTAEELTAQGFRPVGADFPVFLHPKTGDEYALARTERKSGRGYGGFTFFASPEVTLEDDLIRRDLTINAMAEDEAGHVIDPYGGLKDLQARLLRHVSPAFMEDPLRVLRVARFAARYAPLGFTVAQETLELMQHMAASGELDALTPERMWKEISRALMESRPDVFIQTLHLCGALAVLMPEIDSLLKTNPDLSASHTLSVLRQCANHNQTLPIRWACLLMQVKRDQGATAPGSIQAINSRFKTPRDCSELTLLVGQYHCHVERAAELTSKELLELFQSFDVFRRPTRLEEFLQSCEMDRYGQSHPYVQASYIRSAAQAARAITVQPLLEKGLKGAELGDALKHSRLEAIESHRQAYVAGNA
jgi:tRNA nucleotidyltransferase (CCA-adding enzyme)